jgi:hypothetical protein
MQGRFKYKAYGLGFHSQWRFANFPQENAPADVHILMTAIEPSITDIEPGSTYRKIYSDHAVVAVKDLGVFRINHGAEIRFQLHSNADLRLAQRYLLGSIMAILLNQRGRLVLHASVISIDGYGVAFLGASGAGKSSTAAAFLAHGHRILVDDLAAIELTENSAHIYSAFPHINLSRTAVEALKIAPDRLRFIDEVDDKLSFQIIQDQLDAPVQLKRIYMLTDGDHLEFQSLSPQQTVVELVRYTLPSSYVQIDAEAHFKKCVNLANRIEMYRLVRPDSLVQLKHLVLKVEEHIRYLN